MVDIRRLEPHDWPGYREIRLALLEDAPDAFARTFEEAASYPDETWQVRLADVESRLEFPVAAFDGARPVALAWGRIDPADAHIAILNQMWTEPAFRGLGLARRLVLAVIDWASQARARELQLGVTLGNTSARQLYLSMGFEGTGELEPLREGSSKQVETMCLALDEQPVPK